MHLFPWTGVHNAKAEECTTPCLIGGVGLPRNQKIIAIASSLQAHRSKSSLRSVGIHQE